MAFIAQECPRCGAPIPPGVTGPFVCGYCAASLIPKRDGFAVSDAFPAEDLVDPHLRRFWLRGARYRIEGRLGRGDSSDVMLGRRDSHLTERVVAKVLRVPGDADLLEREWSALVELGRSTARGSAHFSRLLPQPVAHGSARMGVHGNEGESTIALYRFESGFIHSFEDVRTAYPGGIPGGAAVWIVKRILEMLTFVHESGFVHGAVLPRHLLVHARDHGVRLCGWACASRVGQPLGAVVSGADEHYPRGALAAQPGLDIAMAARAVLQLMGSGALIAPASAPRPLAEVLEAMANERGPAAAPDALAAVDSAARASFGPPKYLPFAMPGWRSPA